MHCRRVGPFQFEIQNGVTISFEDLASIGLNYPIECAHTLMKLGYEPIPPEQESFFGTIYLALPNAPRYVKYIISVDGVKGCYRGFASSVCQKIVSLLVTNKLNKILLPELSEKDSGSSRINSKLDKLQVDITSPKFLLNGCPPDTVNFLAITGWRMFIASSATIVSQPFYVVTIRMVAQFVGREAKYISLWSSIKAILGDEGISGFFKGLMPRLISENFQIIVPASIFFVTTRIFNQRLIINCITAMSQFYVRRFVYQFDVVSATLAVEGSSMAVGKSPFPTGKFLWWADCWKLLRSLNIQNRGRSSFFRYYEGPTVRLNNKLRPAIFYGPYYSQDSKTK